MKKTTELKVVRQDGWSNVITQVGEAMDKRRGAKVRWENRTPDFYEEMYAGGSIPARIVDLIPQESLRRWVDWTGIDKTIIDDEVDPRCQALDLRGALLRSWTWGRAYGGGCLHIVTDCRDPSRPLQPGEKVLALRDLSRWDLRVLTTDIEYDFGSPNYGYPRIYYLNVQMGSQYKGYPIHWTRMIRFDGQQVPRRIFIQNGYWHDSILNRLYNSIRNYETSNDAVAVCLQDFNVDVYMLKNLANLVQAGKAGIVKDRIELMQYGKSVLRAMMLDADSEKYENVGRSLEGVAELLILQANRLVADTDIPHTKLLGESPDGSNATGNSTTQQWYNFVHSEQENYLRPKLERLSQIIFPEYPELGHKYRPLRQLDDLEQADLRLKTAQTDQIYLDKAVIDPTEIATSRFGGDEYSTETKLDMEAREAGLISSGGQEADDLDEDGDDEDEDPDGNPQDPDGGGAPGKQRQVKPGKEKQAPPKPSKDKPSEKKPAEKKTDADLEPSASEPEPGTPGDTVGAASLVDLSGTQFEQRNEVITPKNPVPKERAFISQSISEPMRDPRTDPTPTMKGPGIPSHPRTFLPTRGNGVTAPSGFDMEKDAGSHGEAREAPPEQRKDGVEVPGVTVQSPTAPHAPSAHKVPLPSINPEKGIVSQRVRDSEDNQRRRAATVLVRRGDEFLMGRTRDGNRWTCPGGIVDDDESMHQGAVRELAEETGIAANRLKFLGTRLVESQMGKSTEVSIYQHHADPQAKPTGKHDPDKEVAEWRWISMKQPLPTDIAHNLKHPNNVVLDHLGLL